jgi:uracil-DNA glycosylase
MQETLVWEEILARELDSEYMKNLKHFLEKEKFEGREIYPPTEEVFYAFKECSYEKTKVVVVGQDPYHGPGQAHGLAFSVRKGIPIPPSLKNIYKELKNDLGIDPPPHGCLDNWAKNGVLLLNATLTVRRGEPKSHWGKGWELFTTKIIQKLFERKDPIVFLLWGKSAQEKCNFVFDGKKTNHAIFKASHPSPYSAANFLHCKHFSKANEFLKECGKEPVNWVIDS